MSNGSFSCYCYGMTNGVQLCSGLNVGDCANACANALLGSAVTSCPTTGLVGCCVTNGPVGMQEQCEYSGDPTGDQSTCTSNSGTWSTTPM
jgi:hypothetical protein